MTKIFRPPSDRVVLPCPCCATKSRYSSYGSDGYGYGQIPGDLPGHCCGCNGTDWNRLIRVAFTVEITGCDGGPDVGPCTVTSGPAYKPDMCRLYTPDQERERGFVFTSATYAPDNSDENDWCHDASPDGFVFLQACPDGTLGLSPNQTTPSLSGRIGVWCCRNGVWAVASNSLVWNDWGGHRGRFGSFWQIITLESCNPLVFSEVTFSLECWSPFDMEAEPLHACACSHNEGEQGYCWAYTTVKQAVGCTFKINVSEF